MLAVKPQHAVRVADLPAIHSDPFDRMLVAQARFEPMTLVTSDRLVGQYGASVTGLILSVGGLQHAVRRFGVDVMHGCPDRGLLVKVPMRPPIGST